MIRAIITPQNTDLHISIPQNYVGKKIEVLLYTMEEVEPAQPVVRSEKKPSDFFGTLSREEGEKMQTYITKSRNEWERDF